jgi:hypothetical protein
MCVSNPSSSKGHFTLWQNLVKRANDSSNLIGGEQKLVHSAFTLESNGQQTTSSKMFIWQHFFGSIGAKSLSGGGKLVHNIYGNPNSLSG